MVTIANSKSVTMVTINFLPRPLPTQQFPDDTEQVHFMTMDEIEELETGSAETKT